MQHFIAMLAKVELCTMRVIFLLSHVFRQRSRWISQSTLTCITRVLSLSLGIAISKVDISSAYLDKFGGFGFGRSDCLYQPLFGRLGIVSWIPLVLISSLERNPSPALSSNATEVSSRQKKGGIDGKLESLERLEREALILPPRAICTVKRPDCPVPIEILSPDRPCSNAILPT
jgi:hypothetical protein